MSRDWENIRGNCGPFCWFIQIVLHKLWSIKFWAPCSLPQAEFPCNLKWNLPSYRWDLEEQRWVSVSWDSAESVHVCSGVGCHSGKRAVSKGAELWLCGQKVRQGGWRRIRNTLSNMRSLNFAGNGEPLKLFEQGNGMTHMCFTSIILAAVVQEDN